MPYKDLVEQIKEWAGLIAATITILKFLFSIGQTSPLTLRSTFGSPKLFKIIRLVQTNTETIWVFLRESSIFVYISILGFSLALFTGLMGALIVQGENLFSGDIIFILALLFGVSMYSLIDDYRSEMRVQRGEHSRVHKQSQIEILADYDTLIIRCLQVLSDIGARITVFSSQTNLITAELPKNIIEIKIKQTQNELYIVNISSDSKLPSIRIDFGSNKKIVGECTKRLLGYG